MPDFLLWTLAAIFGLLPALIWVFIWYRKDSAQPEPKRMILYAFCFGMLGILPFFGIEHVLEYSPNLKELWHQVELKSIYTATIILTFVLAALEEFVKHFAVLRLGKKLDIYFDQIVDGIVYSVSAALGFAFMENVLYFFQALMFFELSEQFWGVFIFRSFATMLGHALFSGIFGYFWGYAFFSKRICAKHTESVSRLWKTFEGFQKFLHTTHLQIIRKHILLGKPSRKKLEKADLMREAFLLATLIHTIFNLLLNTEVFGENLTFLIVPLLMTGFVWLSHQFLKEKNVTVWKAV